MFFNDQFNIEIYTFIINKYVNNKLFLDNIFYFYYNYLNIFIRCYTTHKIDKIIFLMIFDILKKNIKRYQHKNIEIVKVFVVFLMIYLFKK